MAKKSKKPKKRMVTNGDKKPYKADVFNLYIFWSAIPRALKKLNILTLEELGFDIEDNIFQKLLQIKNKYQFAKIFKVSRQAIWEWEHSEGFIQKLKEFSNEDILMRYKKDVDFSFTQKTISEADAARVKLWKELFEGFVGQSKVNVESEDIKDLKNTIREWIEKK